MRTELEVTSFDGTRLWVSVEGDGPTNFLLCDGIGCNGFIWRYLEPELLRRGRVIHLHMRGHGRSAPPADPAAVEMSHLADDWRCVLDTIGCEQGIALGHSMGVQVALELWRRHTEQVAGLVLVCGSFENPVDTFHDSVVMGYFLPLLQRFTVVGGRPLAHLWRRLVSLPVAYHVARLTEVDPDLARRQDLDRYLDHLSRMDPAVFFRMLRGAARHSARAYLPEINVPSLVVAGSRDRFTPSRLSEEMTSLIHGGQGYVVDDGTHTAPIEQPVRVNLEITRFLDVRFEAAEN